MLDLITDLFTVLDLTDFDCSSFSIDLDLDLDLIDFDCSIFIDFEERTLIIM